MQAGNLQLLNCMTYEHQCFWDIRAMHHLKIMPPITLKKVKSIKTKHKVENCNVKGCWKSSENNVSVKSTSIYHNCSSPSFISIEFGKVTGFHGEIFYIFKGTKGIVETECSRQWWFNGLHLKYCIKLSFYA